MHTKLVQIEKSTQWLYGQLLIKVQDVACDLFPQRAIVYEKVLRKNGLPVKYSLQEFSDCDKKKKQKKTYCNREDAHVSSLLSGFLYLSSISE